MLSRQIFERPSLAGYPGLGPWIYSIHPYGISQSDVNWQEQDSSRVGVQDFVQESWHVRALLHVQFHFFDRILFG